MKHTSTIAIIVALVAYQFSFAQDHHKSMSFSAPVRKAQKKTPAKDSVQNQDFVIYETSQQDNDLRANSMVDKQKDALMRDHKIIYIDGKPENADSKTHQDSIRDLVENFFYDQFQSFSDPAAPYFLFMGRDADLAMGIGGCVRPRVP